MAIANRIPIPEGYEQILSDYRLSLNAQNLSENTVKSYDIQFKKLIFTLNSLESEGEQTSEQNKKDLQTAIEIVVSQSKNSPGVVRSAIRSILRFMRFKKGVDTSSIVIPKHKGHRTREVHKCPKEYVDKMLVLIKREDDNLMVRLTRRLVLRSDDAVNLKVSNFNFKRKHLRLIGKGNVEVIKPIVDEDLIRVIKDYIKYRLPDYSKEDKAGKVDFMFPRIAKLGHPTRHFRYLMEWVGKQLDDTYRVHEIRHGAATDLYNAGTELRVLQKFMGHKSIVSTAIYAEPSQATIKEQIARAERRLAGNVSNDPVLSDNLVEEGGENGENIK